MEKILPVGIRKIHFVGIGGIGMSGLARLLKERGYTVTGSDVKHSDIINKLRERGVKINIPHNSSPVKDADLLCFSSAISKDNPEVKAALSLNIPIIKRGALLGKVIRNKEVLAVSGSHGKTTTTSLACFVLKKLGKDIASLVGGVPLYSENSSWWGKDMFVVETDESDASFLEVEPAYSIITNIDKEHIDFYGSFRKLKDDFLRFAKNTRRLVIGWADQREVHEILKSSKKEFIGYGFNRNSIVRAKSIRLTSRESEFKIFYKNKYVCRINIPLLGKHNILNSLSVVALCLYFGFGVNEIKDSFKDFPGTKRRTDFKGEIKGVIFVDDYAHHPGEIAAVLEAMSLFKKRRLVVLFQPHRYSRVKNLISEFSLCFKNVGFLIVTDIYSASEKQIQGINAQLLMKKIGKNFKKDILYIPKEDLVEKVPFLLKRGDCLLCLGAGDINRIHEKIMQRFKNADGCPVKSFGPRRKAAWRQRRFTRGRPRKVTS